VFYAKGFLFNLQHIRWLGTQKSAKVVILADCMYEMETSVNSDSTGICFSRVLMDHFQQLNFITEIRE
jgi:hypothetical protein